MQVPKDSNCIGRRASRLCCGSLGTSELPRSCFQDPPTEGFRVERALGLRARV